MRQENDGAIGRRIAQARREAGLTQDELAERVGVTTRSVQGYEAGTVTPFRHLKRLEEITGRPRAWFLYGDSGGATDGEFTEQLARLVAQIAEDAERIAQVAERLEKSSRPRKPRG